MIDSPPPTIFCPVFSFVNKLFLNQIPVVCKRALPIPVKLIITGVGGAVIGATGGEAAKRLWEYDGSAEIIKEVISAIQ